MTPWSETVPTSPGGYYWYREKPEDEPILVRVVKSYERLLAGPWAGGLVDVKTMGGFWLAVEVPT